MYIYTFILNIKNVHRIQSKLTSSGKFFFRFPGEASEAKVEDRAGRRGEVGRMAMAHNPQGF